MNFKRIAFIAALLGLTLMGAGQNAVAGRLFSGGFMGLNITPATLSYDYKRPPAIGMAGLLTNQLTAHEYSQSSSRSFAGSLGFRLSPQWRIEGELSYSAGSIGEAGERQSRLALMNLYYDIDLGSTKFKPFLSLGAGMATHEIYRGGMDGMGLASETMSGMAWQAGAGLNYQLNDDLSLSGGYRQVGGAALNGNGYEIDPSGHEIRLGVKYKFPKPKAVPYDLDAQQND